MYHFKASKFGDAVDSHQFGLFLFGTINTTWNRYLELINEFTTQPRGYGKTINPIEPSEPQQRVIYVQHTLSYMFGQKFPILDALYSTYDL